MSGILLMLSLIIRSYVFIIIAIYSVNIMGQLCEALPHVYVYIPSVNKLFIIYC